jgi:hypothetical protein
VDLAWFACGLWVAASIVLWWISAIGRCSAVVSDTPHIDT